MAKHLATGQKKVSSALNNLWADIEEMREAQRKRAEEQRVANAAVGVEGKETPASPGQRRDVSGRCEWIF